MTTLKEKAKAYEPPQTKNIADLATVRTDAPIETKGFTREDGTEFRVEIIHVNGEDYRVPTSVLKNLKAMLEEKPELKTFKVKRSGEGLKTTYTVIPLEGA